MSYVLLFCFILVGAAVILGLYRMIKGPTPVDRVIAFDTVAICAVGFIVLLSTEWITGFFLELILIFSALGFFTTVAFVFYLQRRAAERRLEEEAEAEANALAAPESNTNPS
jgi:multicomponent K+:H+ antiporter subunit F